MHKILNQHAQGHAASLLWAYLSYVQNTKSQHEKF